MSSHGIHPSRMMQATQLHAYFFPAIVTASKEPLQGQMVPPASHPMACAVPIIQTIHVKVVHLGTAARNMETVVRRATSVAWGVSHYLVAAQ